MLRKKTFLFDYFQIVIDFSGIVEVFLTHFNMNCAAFPSAGCLSGAIRTGLLPLTVKLIELHGLKLALAY